MFRMFSFLYCRYIHFCVTSSLPGSSGIATYRENPEEAYQSLVSLLDFAQSHIPEQKWSQTSLYVLCTAGMRFLEEEDQAVILGHLAQSVSLNYPFHIPQDGIQVISGQMEGECVLVQG
jgi:Golgi nucleoside diphosphatase